MLSLTWLLVGVVVIGACARVFARPLLLLLPAVPVVDLLGGSVVVVELATGV